MEESRMIVTIDGPAGAGKSTVARALAARLKWTYLDTGAMYRGVGVAVKRAGADASSEAEMADVMAGVDLRVEAGEQATRIILNGEDVTSVIREPDISALASRASSHGVVRSALTIMQQKIGRRGRIVAEGRDMGTVVFPDAGMKFFMLAALDVRAKRRYDELAVKGEKVTRDAVTADMARRDRDDSSREIAPLKPADDAETIDTSDLTVEQVVQLLWKKSIKKFGLTAF